MLDYYRSISPNIFIIAAIIIAVISYFLEESFPNLFLGMRLLSFVLFLLAIMKYFSPKKSK